MPPRIPFLPALLLGAVTIVALAYIHAITHRPEVPDWKREEDPHQYGFPSWYGAPSSPYDPPAPDPAREDHLDILLFIDLDHNSSSLPDAFYTLDSLRARPSVSVKPIAAFAPEWEIHLSVADNLKIAGCRRIMWRIGEGDTDFGNACPDSIIVNEVASQADVVPRVNPRANITLLGEPAVMLSEDAKYENLRDDFGPHWKMGVLAHVLPAANPEVFFPSHLSQLHHAVTYFPRANTPTKLHPRIPTGKQYSLFHAPINPPVREMNRRKNNTFELTSPLRQYWHAQESRLSTHLSKAGVCVFEGWSDGVLDTRMARAMLSGCLVAAVPPDVEYGTLRHLILPLQKSNDSLPSAQIEAALGGLSDKELKQKLLQSFIFARQAFNGQSRLSEIFSIIERWEQGARGYIFPHQFRWNCDSKGRKPEWCD